MSDYDDGSWIDPEHMEAIAPCTRCGKRCPSQLESTDHEPVADGPPLLVTPEEVPYWGQCEECAGDAALDALVRRSDPGDCYDRKRREAKAALAELRAAEERGADHDTLKRLRDRLDLARYTGD